MYFNYKIIKSNYFLDNKTIKNSPCNKSFYQKWLTIQADVNSDSILLHLSTKSTWGAENIRCKICNYICVSASYSPLLQNIVQQIPRAICYSVNFICIAAGRALWRTKGHFDEFISSDTQRSRHSVISHMWQRAEKAHVANLCFVSAAAAGNNFRPVCQLPAAHPHPHWHLRRPSLSTHLYGGLAAGWHQLNGCCADQLRAPQTDGCTKWMRAHLFSIGLMAMKPNNYIAALNYDYYYTHRPFCPLTRICRCALCYVLIFGLSL